MKPLVTFGDPERLVIDYYEGTSLNEADTTIDNRAPSAGLGVAKWVQVELDGVPGADYPMTERATVRVTCYAGNDHRTTVKALASLAQAYLYVHPGDADVAGTSPLVGRSDVITDPDTKNLMVWFTFRVNLKPQPVAA